jgi:hypothetical protein
MEPILLHAAATDLTDDAIVDTTACNTTTLVPAIRVQTRQVYHGSSGGIPSAGVRKEEEKAEAIVIRK